MLNKELLKEAIIEVSKNNNFNYFIDNYSYEIRKSLFFENSFLLTGDYLSEIFNDEQLILFCSHIFTNEEAKNIIESNEFTSFGDLQDLIYYSLSEEDKIKIINTPPYDDKEFLIETLLDDSKRTYYYNRLHNIEIYIKNMSLEEKKDLYNNFKSKIYKEKILLSIENDKEKYKLLTDDDINNIEYNNIEYNNIIDIINDEDILLEIFFKVNVNLSTDLVLKLLKKISDDNKLKIILSEKGKSYYIYNLDIIFTLSYENFIKLLENDKFDLSLIKLYNLNSYSINNKHFKYLCDKLIKSCIFPLNNILNNIYDDQYKIALYHDKSFNFDLNSKDIIIQNIKDKNIVIKNLDIFDSILSVINSLDNSEDIINLLNKKYFNNNNHLDKIKIIKNKLEDKYKIIALYNDNINYDITDSEKIDIILTLSEAYKLEILNTDKSINTDRQLKIIFSLSDEEKINIINENRYNFISTAKSAIIKDIKDSKYDEYKEKKLYELISEVNENEKSYVFSNIVSSINDKDILIRILKNNQISYKDRGIFLTNYSNKIPINYIYVFAKDFISRNDYDEKCDFNLFENLFKIICDYDSKIAYEFLFDINDKISVLYKAKIIKIFNSDKYFDSIKVSFVEENIEELLSEPSLITDILNSVTDINLIDACFNKYIINDEIPDILKNNIVNNLYNEQLKLKYLLILNNFNNITNFINHNDYILSLDIINHELLNLYGNYYSIDKERLIILVKCFGYGILRFIDNKNILDLLNQDEVTLNNVVSIFNKQELINPKEQHIDSVLNAILQRKFRNDFGDVINIFTRIEYNLSRNNIIEAKVILIDMYNYLKIKSNNFLSKLFIKYNIENFDAFLNNISIKDLSIINELTKKYITEKRNDFVSERISNYKERLNLEKSYEKNSLIKLFINSLDNNSIVNTIRFISND